MREPNRYLTTEEEEQIILLYNSRVPVAYIMKKFNVWEKKLYSLVKDNRHAMKKDYTYIVHERIIELQKKGLTYKEITKATGKSKVYSASALKQYKILNPNFYIKKAKKHDYFVYLYLEGYTITYLIEIFKYKSRSSITMVLKNRKIKLRFDPEGATFVWL